MKFITEMELRALYKTEPFTTYVLESDAKITPGARQFLIDRQVTLIAEKGDVGKQPTTNKPKQARGQGQEQSQGLGQGLDQGQSKGQDHGLGLGQGQITWNILRLRGRMEYVESLFLLIAAELLHLRETTLSAEIMTLGKCFHNLRSAEREQTAPDIGQYLGCTEEEIQEHTTNPKKNIDVTDFQLGLENGKEIALLNHLRASIQELESAIMEAYWNEELGSCSRQELIDSLKTIINALCLLIWKCNGGKTWKR